MESEPIRALSGGDGADLRRALLGGQDRMPYKDIRVSVKDLPSDRQQQGFLFSIKASNSKPR